MRHLFGLLKSKLIYEYLPGRRRGMSSFYGELVSKGDLCFDIGSHLGNRAMVLANLGCEVIAVEPHPFLAGYLKKKFAKNGRVTIEEVGLSDRAGESTLYCSPTELTVSSLNREWAESLRALRPHGIRFSERHTIRTKNGQNGARPSHCSSGSQNGSLDARHTDPGATSRSGGQAAAAPLQFSARSQTPAAARHPKAELRKLSMQMGVLPRQKSRTSHASWGRRQTEPGNL